MKGTKHMKSSARAFSNGRFVRPALLLVLALLLAVPAAAQDDDPGYRIGVGDILSITVYGDTALSGRFPVAPDGTIAYPVLGNISVVGSTPARVGAGIGKDLSQHFPGLAVTAAVEEYAPVFVVGDVTTPGKYEYRPGMIALELVALGGGIRRTTTADESTQIQLIGARQDYADLELQIFAQDVARTRLRAELEGHDFDDAEPVSETDPVLREAKQRVLEGEKVLFAMRKSALESEDEALLAQEKSFDEEIETVATSIELHDREIDLMMEDVVSQRTLVERGLTAKSNLREMERGLSSTRRDALELGSFLARARQNKLAIQQRRSSLLETRRNEAAAMLREIDLELARMKARQRALLDTMAELARAAGGAAMAEAEIEPRFAVLRMEDGEYREAGADERAGLRPGDILRVTLPSLTSRQRSASLE